MEFLTVVNIMKNDNLEIKDIELNINYKDSSMDLKRSSVLPGGIYGIITESFSKGRKSIFVAGELIRGGIKIIQYREKEEKTIREKFLECKEIRKMTKDAGVMFIVNDFIDIAMLTDADGVHIGQDDIPINEVRKLIGNRIIGLSTSSPIQAMAALKEGADYIGVGPIYRTNTKKDVCDPVGLEYLDYVVKNIPLPFVAIGGIKENNISEVLNRGARTIALISGIIGEDDIAGMVRKLSEKIIT